jgi:hypothetical protein
MGESRNLLELREGPLRSELDTASVPLGKCEISLHVKPGVSQIETPLAAEF